ncbi:hypothetical protein [Phycisphaera mikurensis]|uniref:Hypothetical membrane protein n=1 Tax=Phycisphaera mikurensis (strain NBRC 102666 / KCTC 22515 / FYK2301M01) TaxID=1142394 RepID=I0IFD3_PHYMF|nr:hypothetical protein [Phycisphaera mikurensis]MBB6440636.1 hypothetical protein [Phycisphaera mikurensis]BAM03971.1 hypothetical membrane protein [Phycisphaera mikurensis NBRC 102666]
MPSATPRPENRRTPTRSNAPAAAGVASATPRRRRVRGLLLATFFLGLGGLYGLVPPSPDQFELTYVAWRLNAGAAPYAGVIDMNWPGAFWLHQAIAWLPQGPVFPWRLLDFAIAAAAAAATARWLKPALGPVAAAAVLLGYPLVYADPRLYWFSGQRDAVCFHLALLAAAWQVSSLRRPRASADLGVGALVAFAVLVKPLALVAAPALLVHNLLHRGQPLGRGLRRAGWNVIGGSATLLIALVLVRLQGAPWPGLVDAAFVYNLIAQGDNALPAATLLALLGRFAADVWAVFGTAALVGLGLLAARAGAAGPGADARRLVLVLLPAGLAVYLLQGKGFNYHLSWLHGTVMIVALATAGVAAGTAARGFARGRLAVPRPVSVASLVLAAAVGVALAAKAANQLKPAAAAAGFTPRAAYLADFNAGVGTTFAEAEALAAALRAKVPPGVEPQAVPAFVFADATSINLLSGRPLPTAFYYPRVLIAVHGSPGSADLARRWDERFARELAAADVDEAWLSADILGIARSKNAPVAAVVDAWLAAGFEPHGRVGGLEHWVRRGPAATGLNAPARP